MSSKFILLFSIVAMVCFMSLMARADPPEKDPVAQTILTKIQRDAVKMKDSPRYVAGFCAGIKAANWEEAAQHGWNGIPEDALMPPKITFPDKTEFNCRPTIFDRWHPLNGTGKDK